MDYIIYNSKYTFTSMVFRYFKFLEEKFAVQDNIIVIEPENQFKKSLAPKDQSFPNEKSKVWQAFEDKKIRWNIAK